MRTLLLLSLLPLLCVHLLFGQEVPNADPTTKPNTLIDSMRTYETARIKGTPPVIDGKLDDLAWDQVSWGGNGFRQISPDKGKPASVQTLFKILYDDKNLYVGIRCLDPEPRKIARRMSRRDSFEG
ncbi:MAG TPA: hypothetical protein VKZ68_06560, partial [Ohtaekwangia sp.]|nr:hypothetical protein [Ohtaekwangia sp.]